MNPDQISSLIDKITVWKRGGQRAPHKPLLILYALARCFQTDTRMIPYTEIDEKLKQLLMEFGPNRKSYRPEYPFWRLQNDGLWELVNIENVTTRRGNTDAKKSELIKYGVCGGFKKDIYDFLASHPQETSKIALQILETNFPPSIHEDIL